MLDHLVLVPLASLLNSSKGVHPTCNKVDGQAPKFSALDPQVQEDPRQKCTMLMQGSMNRGKRPKQGSLLLQLAGRFQANRSRHHQDSNSMKLYPFLWDTAEPLVSMVVEDMSSHSSQCNKSKDLPVRCNRSNSSNWDCRECQKARCRVKFKSKVANSHVHNRHSKHSKTGAHLPLQLSLAAADHLHHSLLNHNSLWIPIAHRRVASLPHLPLARNISSNIRRDSSRHVPPVTQSCLRASDGWRVKVLRLPEAQDPLVRMRASNHQEHCHHNHHNNSKLNLEDLKEQVVDSLSFKLHRHKEEVSNNLLCSLLLKANNSFLFSPPHLLNSNGTSLALHLNSSNNQVHPNHKSNPKHNSHSPSSNNLPVPPHPPNLKHSLLNNPRLKSPHHHLRHWRRDIPWFLMRVEVA